MSWSATAGIIEGIAAPAFSLLHTTIIVGMVAGFTMIVAAG